MLIRCNYCFDAYDEQFDVCPFCGYVRGAPAKEPYYIYPGMVLNNRYIVGQVLGAGGFGITYKVWDKRLETVLAIKEYYPSGLVNRTPGTKDVILFSRNRIAEYNHGLMRFLDEAKSMAKFNSHKNIINVFEYFEENDTGYIVMEFLNGLTLSTFLKSNELDIQTSLDIIRDVCSALKDIHGAGIVHRDISPDNIFMCTNNNIKLIDFGAARFYPDEDRQMTIILKPGYAPPEQYESVNVQGPWTDIYALGATLYLMMTGVKPDESTNRRIDDTLLPPDQIVKDMPEYISNSIMKAVAIDRHLRFNNVSDFEKALNNEKKVLPVMKEKKRRQQRRIATVLASLVVIALGAGFFVMNWNMQKAAETLPDSSISLWYPVSADTDAASAKNAAYMEIVAAFNTSYPNVVIDVKPFARENYAPALLEATMNGVKPTIFESTGFSKDDLNNTRDLTSVVNALELEQFYFLEGYKTLFPDKNQIPLGFTVPVVYLNTTLYQMSESSISDVFDLLYANTAAPYTLTLNRAAAAAFEDAFGSVVTSITTDNAKELFLSGEAIAYLSDTSEFFEVQSAMPGRYKLLRIDRSTVRISLSDMWSMNECSKNERAAAEKLLQFMLSEYSQDYLFIRAQSGHLPLNRDLLDVYANIYNDFSGFFSNIYDYVS